MSNNSKRNPLLPVDLKQVCPNYLNNMLMLAGDPACPNSEKKFVENRLERVDYHYPVNNNVRAYKND